jgi:hypothetical protein
MNKKLYAAAMSGALVLAAPAVALAAPSAPAAERAATRDGSIVKRRAHEAIERRLNTLRRLADRVRDNRRLTHDHRATLTDLINDQIEGLTALDGKIQADTDRETLLADVKSIVTDYRVYLLTVPKVHLVVGADTEVAVADRLDQVAARLQTKIDEAEAAGKDVTVAQGHLDDMKAKAGDARSAASGVPESVLPLLPQDYPDNKPTLDRARDRLREGRTALREAAKLARQVVQDLKAL